MRRRKMNPLTLIAILTLLVGMVPCLADETTTITVTDKPLVKDVSRMGINMGRGSGYCSPGNTLKKPRVYNFEGTSYRQCIFGILRENGFLCQMVSTDGKYGIKTTGMDKIMLKAKVTLLSGPLKGKEVKIKEIVTETYDVWDNGRPKPLALLVFEEKLELPDGEPIPKAGIMIDNYDPKSGNMHCAYGYWNSKDNKTVAGDVPPGSFGCNALMLDGSEKDSTFRVAGWPSSRPSTWHLRFWVKSKDGTPNLTVQTPAGAKAVSLTAEWKQHDLAIDVKEGDGVPFVFSTKGGSALVDNIELWRDTIEGENPTPFTDDFVAALKNLNPGTVRSLQMGGMGVDKDLKPRLESYIGSNGLTPKSSGTQGFNLHHMYELCEYLNSEPWYCLPGTLYLEDIDNYMEYIGAPADVGWGKVRAEQGHPRPWTETLSKIHVEFGNEAWNFWGPFFCGGYDGPDYWKDLIDRAKKSPYYKPNVVFHVGQRGLAGKPEKDAPNADRYTLAPYIVHKLNKEHQDYFGEDWTKAYRYLFAQGVGYARKYAKTAKDFTDKGSEISIYEINHHFAQGSADINYKNTLLPSLGSGLNILNSMMLWLKENHVRQQSFFTFGGFSNTAYTNPGVRLFGACLDVRKGKERYRPHWLALAEANGVIAGDLVQTTHSADEPTFVPINSDRKGKTFSESEPLPVLWSYAFADGKKRGIILVNLDTSLPRDITLKFDGVPVGTSVSRLLSGASLNANNEPDDPSNPQKKADFDNPKPLEVKVVESQIKGFKTGQQLTLPAHSMTTLQWEIK